MVLDMSMTNLQKTAKQKAWVKSCSSKQVTATTVLNFINNEHNHFLAAVWALKRVRGGACMLKKMWVITSKLGKDSGRRHNLLSAQYEVSLNQAGLSLYFQIIF